MQVINKAEILSAVHNESLYEIIGIVSFLIICFILCITDDGEA